MPDKMKSVCFKCHINKWIVDYRGECAENVSSKSIYLSCEQSEKIEKLEKLVRERDCKIKALEKLVDYFAKKVDVLEGFKIADKRDNGDSGQTDENAFTVDKGTIRVASQCHLQPQTMNIGDDELRKIVMENRDNIVESGRDIVEMRQEIASIKEKMSFSK